MPAEAAQLRFSGRLHQRRIRRRPQEVSQVRDGWNEDQLFDALREALRARQAVPAPFIEVAKSAYAWHNIDAELAQLTYDSGREQDRLAGVRSETASVRALTFTSPHLSIELEVTDDALIGQIIPAQEGTIEVQAHEYTTPAVAIDQI